MDPRPLTLEDVPEAVATTLAALPTPETHDPAEQEDWLRRRTAAMVRSDPGGAWVVDDEDGRIAGVALAIARDGVWGLSLLAVRPDRHARGAGGRLLAALTHADGGRAAIILSSTDPRAMRLYARAGFDLHPSVSFAGILDRAAIPAGLRARESDDVEAAAALAAPVRGGAYDPEHLALLLSRPGRQLLVVEGRGFAIAGTQGPTVLAAGDEESATDLLWACLAATPPGATVTVEPVTGGQDWAVRACLEARLVITPQGPVYTRGAVGRLRPWLPSGAIL